jgi:hypothetical protein
LPANLEKNSEIPFTINLSNSGASKMVKAEIELTGISPSYIDSLEYYE